MNIMIHVIWIFLSPIIILLKGQPILQICVGISLLTSPVHATTANPLSIQTRTLVQYVTTPELYLPTTYSLILFTNFTTWVTVATSNVHKRPRLVARDSALYDFQTAVIAIHDDLVALRWFLHQPTDAFTTTPEQQLGLENTLIKQTCISIQRRVWECTATKTTNLYPHIILRHLQQHCPRSYPNTFTTVLLQLVEELCKTPAVLSSWTTFRRLPLQRVLDTIARLPPEHTGRIYFRLNRYVSPCLKHIYVQIITHRLFQHYPEQVWAWMELVKRIAHRAGAVSLPFSFAPLTILLRLAHYDPDIRAPRAVAMGDIHRLNDTLTQLTTDRLGRPDAQAKLLEVRQPPITRFYLALGTLAFRPQYRHEMNWIVCALLSRADTFRGYLDAAVDAKTNRTLTAFVETFAEFHALYFAEIFAASICERMKKLGHELVTQRFIPYGAIYDQLPDTLRLSASEKHLLEQLGYGHHAEADVKGYLHQMFNEKYEEKCVNKETRRENSIIRK